MGEGRGDEEQHGEQEHYERDGYDYNICKEEEERKDIEQPDRQCEGARLCHQRDGRHLPEPVGNTVFYPEEPVKRVIKGDDECHGQVRELKSCLEEHCRAHRRQDEGRRQQAVHGGSRPVQQ